MRLPCWHYTRFALAVFGRAADRARGPVLDAVPRDALRRGRGTAARVAEPARAYRAAPARVVRRAEANARPSWDGEADGAPARVPSSHLPVSVRLPPRSAASRMQHLGGEHAAALDLLRWADAVRIGPCLERSLHARALYLRVLRHTAEERTANAGRLQCVEGLPPRARTNRLRCGEPDGALIRLSSWRLLTWHASRGRLPYLAAPSAAAAVR